MENILIYLLGTLIVGVVVWLRTNQPATTVYDAFSQFQDALSIAPDIVQAVEQLYTTGKLPKDARLDEAMRRLGEWFPDLTDEQIRTAVEFGVFLLKQGTGALDEYELQKTLQSFNPAIRK